MRTTCAWRRSRPHSGACSRASSRSTPPISAPLIDVVNRFGSFFYGSILGVFVLAIGVKRATATGAFVGLLAGMARSPAVATSTNIAFLWHNVVGAVVVVAVGVLVSAVSSR